MPKSDATIIAEYRLCNAIYLDPNLLDDPRFSYDLLVHETPKDFIKSIDEMTRDGVPLNELSIFNKLSTLNINASMDEVHTIVSLNDKPVTEIKDIVSYLETGKRKYESLQHLKNVETILTSDSVLDENKREELKNEFDAAESSMFTLQDGSIKRVMTMKEWGEMWSEEFAKRRNGKRFFFNDPHLDEIIIDGPIPGTCGLFVAASGMGKTAFVTHLFKGFLNAKIPTGFYSMEMGAISSYDRLISDLTQIPYSEIVNPSDEETFESIRTQVEQAKKELDENELAFFSENANVSLNDVKKAIMKFQEKIGQKYCIIFLDLITMIKEFAKSAQNMAQAMELAINATSALSKELGCHIIGTAQVGRGVEEGRCSDPEDIEHFRPMVNDIKNSNALLERCRYVISLFRKKYYIEKYFADDQELIDSTQDIVEIQMLKQNNGKLPRRYYSFYGPTFSITPLMNTEQQFDEED